MMMMMMMMMMIMIMMMMNDWVIPLNRCAQICVFAQILNVCTDDTESKYACAHKLESGIFLKLNLTKEKIKLRELLKFNLNF